MIREGWGGVDAGGWGGGWGGTGRGAQFLRSQHPAPENETEDLYLSEQTRAFGLSSAYGDQGVGGVSGVVMMGGGVGIHPLPLPPPSCASVCYFSPTNTPAGPGGKRCHLLTRHISPQGAITQVVDLPPLIQYLSPRSQQAKVLRFN